jgi:peptidoglycan/LPS O-acetylase OafA/YrhL
MPYPLDASRLYYGTDMRAGELLVGVLLALVMRGAQGQPAFRRFRSRLWPQVLALAVPPGVRKRR